MGRRRKAYNTQSSTYGIWSGMKSRCSNPNDPTYRNYGGRGIDVCERWMLFENFLADMGERPEGLSLDRIDNNSGYRPGNCRWTTMKVQRRNSRQTRFIEHRGVVLPVTDWASRVGLDRNVLFARLRIGWSVERALETPNLRI